MTPDDWREQIGRPIEAARAERSVRSMARTAEISEGLWRQLESGRRPLRHGAFETVSPRATTKRAVCRSLGWPPSAIDDLIAGGAPPTEDLSSRDDDGVRDRVESLERALVELQQKVADMESQSADKDEETNEALAALAARLERLERPTG